MPHSSFLSGSSVQGKSGKTGEKLPCKSKYKYKLRCRPGQFRAVQAYDRGVKILGATAHYAKTTSMDLVEKGRDLEKAVLSRDVRWHIENRILLYANKTVIFE